jgi:hypothetical protein
MFPNLLQEKSGQFWALVALIQSTSHIKNRKTEESYQNALDMLYI